MTLVLTALVAGGCGGGDDGSSEGAEALSVEAGSPPAVADCAFENPESLGSAPAGAGRVSAPTAGTYRYATSGTETVPGEPRPKALPKETETVVTPTRRVRELTCFGSERRISERTRLPEAYVLRGEDVYITALGFDTPNLVRGIAPRPAVLALSGTQSSWSGQFAGRTSGTYSVEIIGRRTFKIGGRKVKAVGLSSEATYEGDATGSRRGETWLAQDGSLVIAESGESSIQVAGGTEKLRYERRLVSLDPEGS